MTTKRSGPARPAAPRTKAAQRAPRIAAHASAPVRPRPAVRRLDDDPSSIIRHFVQTLERMSGRATGSGEQ